MTSGEVPSGISKIFMGGIFRLTWLKRDLGVDLVSNKPNTVTAPVDLTQQELTFSPHMFTGVEITDKGMAHWCGGSMGNARTLHFV